MKIAITGATGFVGRNLTLALSKKYDVMALARHSVSSKDIFGIALVNTDYSLADLRKVLKGVDVVIHLAAKRPYFRDCQNLIENNQLDYRVFQAAEDCGVKHVLFASTRGVYGTQPAPWSEETSPAPVNLYSLAKLHSEETAKFFVRRGLCVTSLRIAQVFGLGEYEGSAVSTFLCNAYQGIPITLTVTGIRREYIYVFDLIRAIEKIMDHPVSGIYNLGSGEVVSLEDMAIAILRAFRRNVEILRTEKPKNMDEYSLMNSMRLRECFAWKPEYSFAEAAEDIARMLDNKEVATYYGLSAH